MRKGDIIGGCLEVVATPADFVLWAVTELVRRIEPAERDDDESEDTDEP